MKPNNDLKRFEQYLIDQEKSERTVEAYVGDLQKFVKWFEQSNGEAFSAKGLTATDVREYRSRLLRAKSSPATINRTLASLRVFATWSVAAKVLGANPLTMIKGVEEQKAAPKWLEKREQAALLRELEREVSIAKTPEGKRQAIRDQALLIMLINTGLRVSELCDLEMDDITLSERKGSVLVREGKGDKQREVPLNTEARHALTAWLAVRPDQGKEIFIGQRGEALRPRAVQRKFIEFGRRASIEVTPHTLRHTFAKNLINSGVTLEKVAALMGHANLNTTRIYTTPSAADLASAVEGLVQ